MPVLRYQDGMAQIRAGRFLGMSPLPAPQAGVPRCICEVSRGEVPPMMPNIDQALYAKFKKEGYRIKQYREQPVRSISEIVRLASLDVCRTTRGIEAAQSDSFKKTVELSIKHLLSNPPMNQPEFDLLHHRCCQQSLAFSSPHGAQIHYGQAQKLLNMSLKYLYNEYATYKGEVNQLGFPANNEEHLFHLPIDSQIRNYLVGKCQFTDPTSLPWSQWTYDQYMSFQNQLRKRISNQYRPLEIDYMLWNTKGASVSNAISCNR